MPKKVLHVYKTFFPETMGGVEQVISNICRGVKRHNVESKVLCLAKSTGDTLAINGVTVVRYKYDFTIASNPISMKLLFAFKKEAAWADIIHYHYPWPFGDLLSLLVPKGKKQIVTYHSDIVRQKFLKTLYYPLEQLFLSRMDKIIATSPNYLSLSKNLKKFQNKTVVIPLAIDESSYPQLNNKRYKNIRETHGQKFMLFIGQLRYYKGLHLLIEAMKGLKIRLVIIGDGPEKYKLFSLCKTQNIHNVDFIGGVTEEDKINYLHACYALILPSHLKSEAFGVALLEGAMCGKPLISCQIGTGVEYVNKHLSTGLVVAPSANKIKKAILYLINNPKKAYLMGEEARHRFENIFSHNKIFKAWSQLYNSD